MVNEHRAKKLQKQIFYNITAGVFFSSKSEYLFAICGVFLGHL